MGVVYEAVRMPARATSGLEGLALRGFPRSPRGSSGSRSRPQAAAHLHHPHIVPIFAVGCDQGVHYYAMQYIEGRTIAAVIARPQEGMPRANDRGGARRFDRLSGSQGPPPSASTPPTIGGPPVALLPATPPRVPCPRSASSHGSREFFRRRTAGRVQAAEAPSARSRPGHPPSRHQAGQSHGRRTRRPLGHRLRPGSLPRRRGAHGDG